MVIKISRHIYLKEVVLKTVISFENALKLSNTIDESYYYIEITNNNFNIESFYKELDYNDLRFQISKQTDTIKKLIIGRALYSTCIKL